MQKSKAFTLAETLLTLAIIGVVIALMLRALIRVNPDTEKILFIKSYHALESAVTNIINDSSKYDSRYMTETERQIEEANGNTLNQDFRDKPLSTAEITYVDANGTLQTTKGLSQKEALCYFISDQFNLIGGVSCPNNSNYSFKTSNGVCYSISETNSDGETTVYISPDCVKFSSDEGIHKVKIYRDGKMAVPSDTKAYEWMQSQIN